MIKNIIPRRWSAWVLLVFAIFALCGNFISSNRDYLIGPVFSYSSNDLDHQNANYVSPFDKQNLNPDQSRHWLGTDSIGRDVLAGILNGSKIAFWVGILTVLLSLFIGIPVGLVTGFYGNNFEVGWIEFVLILVFALFTFYYLIYFTPGSFLVTLFILLGFGLFKTLVMYAFEAFLPHRKKFNVPIDDIMTKFMEIFKSIPTLILLILLLGMLSETGIISISIFLGCVFWIRIARYVRAEVLALRESDLIDAQKALGSSDFSIMFKHCLPKALPPVLVAIIFLFGATILLEATLSFFGLGLPLDQVSWGSLLNESKRYLGAWWMAVFPGLCLYAVIASLAKESEYWSRKFNPQLKEH